MSPPPTAPAPRASGAATAAVGRLRAVLPRSRDLAAMVRHPRQDLVAGVTVAVVALPLALAFGITSGLGAGAGLITAVVAGIVAAFFGGSPVQVSGPTGAMTVVLVPIVAVFGATGVLVVGLVAGLILVVLALLGAGRSMQYVPLPLVEGFTVGIAAIIALQQVPAALGQTASHDKVVLSAWEAVQAWTADPVWAPVVITAAVVAAMVLSARFVPRVPLSLAAVLIVTVVVSRAHVSVPVIGSIPSGLPAPSLPSIDVTRLGALVLPAVAVAALAALESLLSATVADGMTVGERHDPDRELFGQGLANLASPLFGGIPATAAIARTAVNVRSGARSRLAAIVQSVVLLLVVLVGSQGVGAIPLAALAGVLIATAAQMVEVSGLTALLRSTRGDAAVLVITAVATLVFDLVTAVILGLLVAGFAALAQMSRSARIDEVPLDEHDHSEEEHALLDEHVVAFRLDGPLFFGAAHRFLLELTEVSDVRVVVLRMSRVAALDATGASVLADTITRLEGRGIVVMISGLRPEHARVLDTLGVFGHLSGERHVFATTPEAISHARRHAARAVHVPGDEG